MLRISNIKVSLDTSQNEVAKIVAQELGYKGDFLSFQIVKKAIDARSKGRVHFVYSVDFRVSAEDTLLAQSSYPFVEKIVEEKPEEYGLRASKCQIRPVIVGSGPAGMLAGIALAEAGLRPIILERGCPVPKRQKDVKNFWDGADLNPDSNVQFGEGGAGTFSDGKLMSGIKKDIYTSKVLKELVAAGAPEEILYLAKPHIGTDKLALVVQKIREKIVSLGGEYRFENRLESLIIKDGQLCGIKIRNEEGHFYELMVTQLIVAVGHSARDTFEMLYRSGVLITQKPFSIGARIEHRQSLINKSQYGQFAAHQALGSADYKLAFHQNGGRSAYTFCMCPGGEVVAAASEKGRVVTNGMSRYARNKENANSALLVGVEPKDFGGDHPLQGMYWQRELEEKAFQAGGGNYKAPAQLVGDLLKNRASTKLGEVKPSYTPGVELGDLGSVLPAFVIETMQLGLCEMNKRLNGFSSFDAVLTGVESRSSSPIRIIRDETLQSNIKGLYPCGEGAGYAGGIMSAAVDGLKCAEKVSEALE